MPERSLQGRIHGVLNNQDKGMQVRFRYLKVDDLKAIMNHHLITQQPVSSRA